MAITVSVEPIGRKLHRLTMFAAGEYIGEYERSQNADIERKNAEIEAAADILLALHQQHGELCVRWDGKAREKSIRARGVQVGVIPKSAWRTPSWER